MWKKLKMTSFYFTAKNVKTISHEIIKKANPNQTNLLGYISDRYLFILNCFIE